jgi:glyoxylase-like metal-dependent hydrolase (beta-lactamase superfamily II)
MIPLEDNFNDILRKAQRGLRRSDEELSQAAGISLDELRAVISGQFEERVVRRLAKVMGLGADALADQSWRPLSCEMPGLAMVATPYGGMWVNAFLAWDEVTKRAVAFDTGADARPMLAFLREQKLELELVLLTHAHSDHIGQMPVLRRETGARALASEREPVTGAESFADGQLFPVGGLEVEARRTSGHTRGGATFVVRGLARAVAVTGDALFAGSMGGAATAYEEALRWNREQVLTLPEDAVICPGHGPMTTVGEEKQHNPFFTA